MTTTRLILAAAVVMVAGSAQALSAQPSQPAPTSQSPPRSRGCRRRDATAPAWNRRPSGRSRSRRRRSRATRSTSTATTSWRWRSRSARAKRPIPAFYRQADEAVRTSLALSPDNFEALKVRTWSLLGQHRFAEALAVATALNTKVPDDLMVYGMLTDANIELGKLRRRREVGAVDARPAAGQHPGADPGGLPARALRRHRGRHRADAVGLQPHAVPGNRGSRLGAHADRTSGTRAAAARPRPSRRSSRRWTSSPTTTTRSAAWPTCAPRRSGTARRPTCSSSATPRRRIPRTCSSWPKRRRAPA